MRSRETLLKMIEYQTKVTQNLKDDMPKYFHPIRMEEALEKVSKYNANLGILSGLKLALNE